MHVRRALVALLPLVVVAGALTSCLPSGPRTFYVSPTGSDAAAGTSTSTPWRTVARVNSVDLRPGDRVRFQGGATFAGLLYLEPNDGGTSSSPVVIDSYNGRATLQGGLGNAIYAWRVAGVTVQNLKLVGSGASTNGGDGLAFYNDLPGDQLLSSVRIADVESSGFGHWGILVGGGLGRSGYSGVRIERTSTHDNGMGGVLTFATAIGVHRNVYVGQSSAFHNAGRADATHNSGNGLVLGGVDGGTIEHSTAYENGGQNNPNIEGPVGIWAYDANNVVIQFNEAFANRTGSGVDGGGFDLDQNVTNSVIQYNYSHGNDGPGYMLAHRYNTANHHHNVVRYNISENDRRRNAGGALDVWGSVRSAEIYHNTVFLGATNASAIRGVKLWQSALPADAHSVHFRNNIFSTERSIPLLEVTSAQLDGATDILFQGNDWFRDDGSAAFLWGGTRYDTLGAWRDGTGQEMVGAAAVGTAANPALVSPGGGTAGAQLTTGSPMVDAGLDLTSFGVDPGGHDFYGGPAPLGLRPDIGAHELR